MRLTHVSSSRSAGSSTQRSTDRWSMCPSIFIFALLLVPIALTSCDAAIEHPTGGSELLLRVETGGGFVPVEYNLTHTPEFSLYGDGTVIVTGPTIEIWPPPALPNLQRSAIGDDDIAKLLDLAEESGLMTNGVDYGQPTVTDMPTTVITINSGGKTYVSNLYALGFGETFDQGSADLAPAMGLTLEQVEAREKVLAFVAKTTDLGTFTGKTLKSEKYEFTSLAAYSLPYDSAHPMYDESVEPNRLDWPLGDLSTLGETAQPDGNRRVVVSGDDLAKLRPLLEQATQITLWKSGGHEYYLYFRPLLPEEKA